MRCGRCIACVIGSPVVCADTERAIRRDERAKLRALVAAGLDGGDLNRLRRDLNSPAVKRTSQLLVHALLTVLDALEEEAAA